jgi:hypothetical protein
MGIGQIQQNRHFTLDHMQYRHSLGFPGTTKTVMGYLIVIVIKLSLYFKALQLLAIKLAVRHIG